MVPSLDSITWMEEHPLTTSIPQEALRSDRPAQLPKLGSVALLGRDYLYH